MAAKVRLAGAVQLWGRPLIRLQTLSAKNAAALDQDLMSSGAFSIDQLMELAGLSVSQAGESSSLYLSASVESVAVYRVHPLDRGRKILVACGPGNNGAHADGCSRPQPDHRDGLIQAVTASSRLAIFGITATSQPSTTPSRARTTSIRWAIVEQGSPWVASDPTSDWQPSSGTSRSHSRMISTPH